MSIVQAGFSAVRGIGESFNRDDARCGPQELFLLGSVYAVEIFIVCKGEKERFPVFGITTAFQKHG